MSSWTTSSSFTTAAASRHDSDDDALDDDRRRSSASIATHVRFSIPGAWPESRPTSIESRLDALIELKGQQRTHTPRSSSSHTQTSFDGHLMQPLESNLSRLSHLPRIMIPPSPYSPYNNATNTNNYSRGSNYGFGHAYGTPISSDDKDELTTNTLSPMTFSPPSQSVPVDEMASNGCLSPISTDSTLCSPGSRDITDIDVEKDLHSQKALAEATLRDNSHSHSAPATPFFRRTLADAFASQTEAKITTTVAAYPSVGLHQKTASHPHPVISSSQSHSVSDRPSPTSISLPVSPLTSTSTLTSMNSSPGPIVFASPTSSQYAPGSSRPSSGPTRVGSCLDMHNNAGLGAHGSRHSIGSFPIDVFKKGVAVGGGRVETLIANASTNSRPSSPMSNSSMSSGSPSPPAPRVKFYLQGREHKHEEASLTQYKEEVRGLGLGLDLQSHVQSIAHPGEDEAMIVKPSSSGSGQNQNETAFHAEETSVGGQFGTMSQNGDTHSSSCTAPDVISEASIDGNMGKIEASPPLPFSLPLTFSAPSSEPHAEGTRRPMQGPYERTWLSDLGGDIGSDRIYDLATRVLASSETESSDGTASATSSPSMMAVLGSPCVRIPTDISSVQTNLQTGDKSSVPVSAEGDGSASTMQGLSPPSSVSSISSNAYTGLPLTFSCDTLSSSIFSALPSSTAASPSSRIPCQQIHNGHDKNVENNFGSIPIPSSPLLSPIDADTFSPSVFLDDTFTPTSTLAITPLTSPDMDASTCFSPSVFSSGMGLSFLEHTGLSPGFLPSILSPPTLHLSPAAPSSYLCPSPKLDSFADDFDRTSPAMSSSGSGSDYGQITTTCLTGLSSFFDDDFSPPMSTCSHSSVHVDGLKRDAPCNAISGGTTILPRLALQSTATIAFPSTVDNHDLNNRDSTCLHDDDATARESTCTCTGAAEVIIDGASRPALERHGTSVIPHCGGSTTGEGNDAVLSNTSRRASMPAGSFLEISNNIAHSRATSTRPHTQPSAESSTFTRINTEGPVAFHEHGHRATSGKLKKDSKLKSQSLVQKVRQFGGRVKRMMAAHAKEFANSSFEERQVGRGDGRSPVGGNGGVGDEDDGSMVMVLTPRGDSPPTTTDVSPPARQELTVTPPHLAPPPPYEPYAEMENGSHHRTSVGNGDRHSQRDVGPSVPGTAVTASNLKRHRFSAFSTRSLRLLTGHTIGTTRHLGQIGEMGEINEQRVADHMKGPVLEAQVGRGRMAMDIRRSDDGSAGIAAVDASHGAMGVESGEGRVSGPNSRIERSKGSQNAAVNNVRSRGNRRFSLSAIPMFGNGDSGPS